MDGTALIQFVGLIVVTLQSSAGAQTARTTNRALTLSGPPTVVAIVPSVRNHDGHETERTIRNVSRRPLPVNWSAGIETHTAILAYKKDDEIDLKGWSSAHFRDLLDANDQVIGEWRYIEISGERNITIRTGRNNPAFPAQLAGLPSIQAQVGAWRDLLPGYKPPNYSAAAAVIKIPSGTLSICETGGGRVDTKIELANDGTLTISGAANRYLTLKGNAGVAFANVPVAFVKQQGPSNSPDHYKVYCAMVAGTVSQCDTPAPNGTLSSCDEGSPIAKIAQGANSDLPAVFRLMGFECSNTQWP